MTVLDDPARTTATSLAGARAQTGLQAGLEGLRGRAHPLGATVRADGVNFSVYSENATAMQLLLFDDPLSVQPTRPGTCGNSGTWSKPCTGPGSR
jgi:hypothetical protein